MLSYVTNREISIISFFVFVFVFVFGMISLLITKLHLIIILLYLLQTQVTLSNNFIVFLFFLTIDSLRASVLKNATLSYFTIPKNYFINYTIPFYNTPYIPKLYYFTFSLKYYFLIFLNYFFPIITLF